MAKSLIKEAKNRYRFTKSIKKLPENTNFIIENSYAVMRGLIEAHMRLKGLKCYSHQSKISYTSKLNFPRSQVLFLDELRKIRNKIKYEGVDNNLQYAETVENFMDNIYFKLLQEVRKLLAEHKKV